MSMSFEMVATLCAALEKEPLFHMSLGSKELFHSNFLAWFADCFPEQSAAVFRPWAVPLAEARAARSERESSHLDLVLHLPGLAPIAVENKVFSVPDEEQLGRYAGGALARREVGRSAYTHILLSLISPGWTMYNGWRRVSYRELAQALYPQVAHIRAADTFAADLVEHYIALTGLLAELFEQLGIPAPDEPLLLNRAVVGCLERAQVSAGVQKARMSCVALALRSAVKNKGWPGILVSYGFTRGMGLLQGFLSTGADGGDPAGDALGWQIQGAQCRLAVMTGQLQGPARRKERETYVAERYPSWFDFTPLEAVTGTMGKLRAHKVRGGRWIFQGYDPNFVYRYCTAPQLTPAQIVELGLLYLDRARLASITNERPV